MDWKMDTCDSSQERHPIFQNGLNRKRSEKVQGCTFAAWELYEAYFLGENKENPKKSRR